MISTRFVVRSYMTSVAFMGLGVMGRGMAARLIEQRMPVVVWNRSRDRADALVAASASSDARVAASPREAAATADVVISMVADDTASRAVWLGEEGALAGARKEAVLIESSTLSPAWIEELATRVSSRGCVLLDAPVTGSRAQAAAGQLLFLVGGPAETLERARPVLAAMSRAILHVGPTGSGARLKLVNNFVCGVQAVALAEAVAMIERTGMNRDLAASVLADGAPGSPLVKALGPRMIASDYTVNFGLDLMRKDLLYAIAEADRFGLHLETAAAARDRFSEASAAGLGGQDFSAVVDVVRTRRGDETSSRP
jgi:3-hydroxyisobutyrate dehydrogenase